MKQVAHGSGPSLLIGIPTLGRPVPLEWAMAFKSLSPPINFNVNFSIVFGQEIGVARQALAEQAVATGCKYLFFLGDDVVVPGHTLRQLIYRMENMEGVDAVGGVYCAKADPPAPLIFQGNGSGSYWDWKIGEFFEVTGFGMDCTLIRCSALEKMQKPWFKTVDIDQHIDGVAAAESWTEDLFFFDRLTKSGGRAFIDASIICEHWDVYTRKAWKLPSDSLPMRVKGVVKDKKCLMLGPLIPLADETYDFVRCTAEADSSADYRLAYDNLPFETAEFDFVVVSEPLLGIDHYLPEWKRVSRPGAKIAINLHPDLHKGRLAKRLKGHIDGSFLEIHNE